MYDNNLVKKDLRTLTKLINEWDPFDLICIGAPDDEYEYIVSRFYSMLNQNVSESELLQFFKKDISNYFGISIFSYSEPYKSEAIIRTQKSLSKIYNWYKDESLKNNANERAKFFIIKKLMEIKNQNSSFCNFYDCDFIMSSVNNLIDSIVIDSLKFLPITMGKSSARLLCYCIDVEEWSVIEDGEFVLGFYDEFELALRML